MRREALQDVKDTLGRLKGELEALALFNAANDVVTARDPELEKEFAELVRIYQRLEVMRAWESGTQWH